MDGVYKVVTCENGRPLYKRDTKDKTGQAFIHKVADTLLIPAWCANLYEMISRSRDNCRNLQLQMHALSLHQLIYDIVQLKHNRLIVNIESRLAAAAFAERTQD